MRREVPLFICFIMGALMAVQFFVPHQFSITLYQYMLRWLIIVLTFAMLLGIGSLIKVHSYKVRFKREGWGYSIVALIGLAMSIVTGMAGILGRLILGQERMAEGFFGDFLFTFFNSGIDLGSGFMWLFSYIQIPMQATMFSLLAFFIVSASFRTFRARSLEAFLLLIAAIIVMLGRVPLEGIVGQWLPDLAEWILEYPNMAAKRGIMIGVGLGAMSMALKIILGIERSWLGGTE
ncbi:MAG: hypothetical protein JSW52_06545 [Candidatus Coatesbacteria bacterium]|nr:MAG: hypothetical protein JSW52_06545 [Candidatus Coatesbacteria bacterium]